MSRVRKQQVWQHLFHLMKPYPLGIAIIIVLGMGASLAEGFGLSLFLPFLESLTHSGSTATMSGFPAQLNQLFQTFPSLSKSF